MLSIARTTPPPSTEASLYQGSIYSSYCLPQLPPSLNNSSEWLLPPKKAVPSSKLRYSGPGTTEAQKRVPRTVGRRMSTVGVDAEQKKSYGIGGAGNIRRPSDVIYPPRTNPDGTRRHSSVWSSITTVSPSSSPQGKRNSLMSLFRKGTTGVAVGDSNVKGYKNGDEVEYNKQ